jgi:shikimate dehydrogenase
LPFGDINHLDYQLASVIDLGVSPMKRTIGAGLSKKKVSHRPDWNRSRARARFGPMITGKTTLIAHLGYPTEAFKAPMIYNPWFEMKGIDAVVIPMGVKASDYASFLKNLFRLTNIRGALVTMPHKVTTAGLMDELTTTAKVAGSCNAILLRPDGSLLGDMFDGAGFVRGVMRKGRKIAGARALVVGSGGVGSAIAASLAAAGATTIGLFDASTASAEALGGRLRQHYPALNVTTGSKDPDGFDIVVNATPMGMNAGDPLPIDIDRVAPGTFVGEVVMKAEFTPLLQRAIEKGCPVQVGTDMLFEQIPAYLEFFGFGTTTPEELRSVARLQY